jgi:hypothetical protein
MTMGIYGYKTKKDLKEKGIGQPPEFIETSIFGSEYKGDGKYVVVGPNPQDRKWFAEVEVFDGLISKVK